MHNIYEFIYLHDFACCKDVMNQKHEFQQRKEYKLYRKKWREQRAIKFQKKAAKVDEEDGKAGGFHRIKLDNIQLLSNFAFKHGCTVSIAVPGSILENAQSPELKTYLAGQIARAACIFKIDEVIVFDDWGEEEANPAHVNVHMSLIKETRSCCAYLAKILQYLECPQYLRKQLFPLHKDLQFAGILNPLDAPHHFRQNDDSPYREGVVVRRPIKQGGRSLVNVGLGRDVVVDCVLQPGTRVTVKLEEEVTKGTSEGCSRCLRGQVVPPWQPRAHLGTYWGYQVRLAPSLRAALSNCPFPGGQYDLTIGTSDKGTQDIPSQLPHARHALILFGGVQGLEAALESNGGLLLRKVGSDASLLFDYYFNTCPGQGSRTIRTEEALLISLSVLLPKIVFLESV